MMAMNYIEIYNEQIQDLLTDTTKKTHIIEQPNGDIVVEGIVQEIVRDENDIIAHLSTGDARRATAATNMNEHSSRSHALFRLRIESRAKDDSDCITTCQLNLVDLAGSERAASTGASGQTLKEGCHINKSLFMLGRVINDLTSNSSHVPYRDSVLTRILQPALGGNAKTAIICTVTHAATSFGETKSTLGFASSAKLIKNATTVNYQKSAQANDALLVKQRREIDRLTEECNRLRELGEKSEKEDDEVDVYKERIKKLQQMVLNSNSGNLGLEPQRKKKVNRRMTWHPNQIQHAETFQRGPSQTFSKENTTTTEQEFANTNSENILDRLDEDFEYRLISNQMSQRGSKRSLDEMSPSRMNIQKKIRFSPGKQFSQQTVNRLSADTVMIRSEALPAEKSKVQDEIVQQLQNQLKDQKQALTDKELELNAAHERNNALVAAESQLKEKIRLLECDKATAITGKSIDTFDATKIQEELENENITLKHVSLTYVRIRIYYYIIII